MTFVPRVDAASTAGWPDLVEELDRWGESDRAATLWWRDDDAVAATPQLASLLRLAGEIPLALAVIPAEADPDLAAALDVAPRVSVLQHGWRHANHAPRYPLSNGKKSEFPAGRPASAVRAELAAGNKRLAELFGPRALPILVPPWNRFAAEFLPLLAEAGITGLSAMARREAAALPAGIPQVDVHVDLVAWRRDRGFIGADPALSGLIGHLRARRFGAADPDRPTGILTHHLVMDRATADFLGQLAALIGAHRAARWVSPAEPLSTR